MSVCSVSPDDISNTNAARITKLNIQVFYDEGSKGQVHNVCVGLVGLQIEWNIDTVVCVSHTRLSLL